MDGVLFWLVVLVRWCFGCSGVLVCMCVVGVCYVHDLFLYVCVVCGLLLVVLCC